ncbi:WSC-domain-containing protein [Glonium stellatum]|uniref:WSC-domain-containing protein n=1 Tax=Glonium stellatum TaxID=574774 RepID=A0A8E2JZ69_9PEZI|nr:WSC-domain-containing protein [Glonium stellatum]
MSFKMISTAFAVTALLSSATAFLEKRTQTPLPPCSYPYTPFIYSGCYYDAVYNRSLPFMAPIEFNNATVEQCTAACKGNGYRYAGLEYYGQCYCGASISSDVAPPTDCNFTCNGDPNEICGGQDRLSIYQDPTFPDASDIACSSEYKSLGCYTEGSNGRSLAYSQIQLNASIMTTELCLNACGAKGYPFAGTEYSQECYCGVVLGNGTVPAPASDCNMLCNGDSSETCGGQDRLNLYVSTYLESAEPCEAPPVSSSSSSSSTPTPSSAVYSSSSTVSNPSSTVYSSSSWIYSSSSIASSSSSTVPSSSSTKYSSSSSSTLSTVTTSCPIPSNTYSPPPPPSSTVSTSCTPAPTSSCLCATPTPWSGSKAVGGYQLPCVGCNDQTSQRPSYPFKLFNQKNFGQCPVYGKGKTSNACTDACTTQYTWCMSYANSCKNNKYAPESYSSANNRCRQQYSDCANANQAVVDDGRCNTTSKNTPATSNQWYTWCSNYISQWFH